MRTTCLSALLLLLLSAPAIAQFDTATVVGTVRDGSKGVVPGAKVTLTAVDTGISSFKMAGNDGNYEFAAVKPGQYVVTAEKSGFALALVDNVQAQVGARMRVDLEMPLAGVTEKVQVTASSPLVETDSSQRGQVISGDQTRALPLISREYSSLALLTTGVKLGGSSLTTGNTPREGAFNVNGLRSVFNNFLIDGVDNNAYGTSNQGFSNQVMQPTPDAIGEFKVVTNNMSAEYGRAAGATINVSYKSGTNTLHGSGWEFLRNDALNATGFFKPATGKPGIDRHQFGGLLGGPIVKNKAFFFGDYEGQRQTRNVAAFASVATPDQRRGIFTVDIRDPRTGIVYPAGTPIPVTAFAQKVLAALPDTNLPGFTNNYSTTQEFTADYDKANGKVDLQASPSLSLFGRYGFRNLKTFDQPIIPGPSGGSGNGNIYGNNRQAVLGTTWTPSGSSLLEVRFGYSWTQAGKNPPSLGSDSALKTFGLPGLPDDPRISGGLPTVLITGYADLGRQATNPQWQ
ncbi:MAG: carboxypeptidase regulatory-like domain-containing protein, partial [Vicinamibacterales bacterium]